MLQFIFSTALDGKIKAWLYDNLGSRVDYDAPGRWCTTMAYSADGTRLVYSYAFASATSPHHLLVCQSELLMSILMFTFSFGWWVFIFTGSFHVEQVRMGIHISLNGMKVKGQLKGPTKGSGNVLWVLCNLIQLKIGFWLLAMISLLNFGIWTTFNF